jgi:hypothetical protein
MSTVCLIGNSHVANLKKALPAVAPEFPDVVPTFFASEGVSMELDIVGGKLRGRADHVRERMAMTSGTDGDIAPVYDAYVLCGLTLSSMRAIRASRATMKTLHAAGGKSAVTAEAVAEGMVEAICQSLAIDIAAKLRRLTKAPIFVIATPLTAYERHPELWQALESKQRLAKLARAYDLACAKAAERYGAVFVPQPPETIGPNLLTTRPQFYLLPVDKVKAEAAHHTHMNTAFGEIVLRDALRRVTARLAAN